jgi:hypothetical protein
MTLLVNYANHSFHAAQRLNSQTGRNVAGFDRVVSYTPRDIDGEFFARNRDVLVQARGNGYWLWKPYFIRRSLDLLRDGDALFYCDAGAYFVAPIAPFIECCFRAEQDVFPTEMQLFEKDWTKRDAFLLLGCDAADFAQSLQRQASYILLRKSASAVAFADEFLRYAQDVRVLTDRANEMGEPDYPGFREHRHDQSIFSLLTKKHGFAAYADPSQYGNPYRMRYPDSTYGQVIEATRKRQDSLPMRLLRRTVGLDNPMGRWLLRM